jgi:hypothetical protein
MKPASNALAEWDGLLPAALTRPRTRLERFNELSPFARSRHSGESGDFGGTAGVTQVGEWGGWETVGDGTTRILPQAELGRDDLSEAASTGIPKRPRPVLSIPPAPRLASAGEDATTDFSSSLLSPAAPMLFSTAAAAAVDRALLSVPLESGGFVGVSSFAPSGAKALWPAATACIPACAASMQRGMSCDSTCSSWKRMSSRTVVTSTTSSMLIWLASLRLRGTVLSQSADNAGRTQWSTEYARASRS